MSNPIDIATGTGRMMWQILDKIEFDGVLYGLDANKKMCEFLQRKIKRDRRYTQPIKVVQGTTKESLRLIKEKSSFVISSFGFPSRITNKRLCREELWAIHELLDDGGLFFTIGWDETFNDELSEMWFKYVPDRIRADNFEEWRASRAAALTSARNSQLTWFKKGIRAPLQFSSIEDSAHVMGHLFGRDAAQWAIENHKTEWSMSLGITCNTKAELFSILQNYEKRN